MFVGAAHAFEHGGGTDAGYGLLAGGVEVGEHDGVGFGEGFGELLCEVARAGVEVGLEGYGEVPPGVEGAHGGYAGAQFVGVVGVVVDYDASACGLLEQELEAPLSAHERGHGAACGVGFEGSCEPACGEGSYGVFDVDVDGHAELYAGYVSAGMHEVEGYGAVAEGYVCGMEVAFVAGVCEDADVGPGAGHELVVFTPAVPAESAIMTFFRTGGFRMIKRSEALGIITDKSKALCFAGTHGKTTTSAMAAHILHTCSCGCNAFLGGILRNCGTNLLLAPASPWTVAEADEYDRSSS